jgi:hypothetical protein
MGGEGLAATSGKDGPLRGLHPPRNLAGDDEGDIVTNGGGVREGVEDDDDDPRP